MDVDEDDEGTQRTKRVQDYGIEVDFSSLEDDEREEVCPVLFVMCLITQTPI